MEYAKAQDIRKTSFSKMMIDKMRTQSITKSVGGTISDKFKASLTGIQEKLDPLNIAKKLTGGSNLAPAILGKLTGRKLSSIRHFTGGDTKTYKSLGPIASSGDSSDALKQLYVFMVKSHEQEKKRYNLEKVFKEEQRNEDQKNHEQFIEVLKMYTRLPLTVDTAVAGQTPSVPSIDSSGLISTIVEKIGNIVKFITELFLEGGLFAILAKKVADIFGKLKFLLEPFKLILDVFKKMNIGTLFRVLKWFTGPVGLALLGAATIVAAAELLRKWFKENVANANVLSPEQAAQLLKPGAGADREIEKYGGREALVKLVREGHIRAKEILDSGDPVKINDAGGEEFLKNVVARGQVELPPGAETRDLSQYETRLGQARPMGDTPAAKMQRAAWEKMWGDIYDLNTGIRKDLVQTENENENKRLLAKQTLSERLVTPTQAERLTRAIDENVNAQLNRDMLGSFDAVNPTLIKKVNTVKGKDTIPSTPASVRDNSPRVKDSFDYLKRATKSY